MLKIAKRGKFRALAKKKDEERMLTVKEAASRIGAGETSVRLWARQGRFAGAKTQETPYGDFWLIPESVISNFDNPGRGRPQKPL